MSASERPATRIVPALGSSSLISSRITVDLPLPVEPTRNTNSPPRIVNDTSSRPVSPLGYCLLTRANSITAGRVAAGARGRSSRTRMSASVVAMRPDISRGDLASLPLRAACKAVCSGPLSSGSMPQITSSTAPNGLPIHRVALEGTRATTILVAFDAGARTERPEENGMAHFLEHLVFKGGELYDDYRKVNETAERMGGVLNAYTSHDLVAFHITVRAESAMDAIDLLTDFVGRPKIDAGELDRERGVVIQEIQRYKDQPSAVAEEVIDRAAFGDHPLGRTVLGPEEHLRTFTRDGIVAFRERRWAGARGGAFIVGNLEHVAENGAVSERFARFPPRARPERVG